MGLSKLSSDVSVLGQAGLDRPWLARNLPPASWVIELKADVRSELEGVLDAAASGRRISLEDTAPAFSDLARELSGELEYGRGFVVLRGLPISDPAARALPDAILVDFLLTIGQSLGRPVPQTTDGALVSYICDLGRDASSPLVRGHQTSAELPFHCDRADVIGLLCVRPARQGGLSRLVSAVAVHDILQLERPDLLEVLYQPFPQDRRGEEAPGQDSWATLPIFARHEGRFVSRYIRRFIESARRFDEAPKLTSRQLQALDAIDEILVRPGIALDLDFQPGDLQLLNNSTIWHARTAFSDSSETQGEARAGRLLLRLWLAPTNSRALPESFAPLYGCTEAGALRGGVWCDLSESADTRGGL